MGEPNDQVSDCSYCGMRFKVLGLPHKYGCPGLEIERLERQRKILSEQLTDKCDELKALTAEGTFKDAVVEAAQAYLDADGSGPPDNLYDALNALAAASGSQPPPLEDLPIDDSDRAWADSRHDPMCDLVIHARDDGKTQFGLKCTCVARRQKTRDAG